MTLVKAVSEINVKYHRIALKLMKYFPASRSRRKKVEKKSASAFERLRELKQAGSKNKWVAEEDTKVYDEVDEEEYTKIVSKRASDWIVDDGEFDEKF
jgi:hypothetical protein